MDWLDEDVPEGFVVGLGLDGEAVADCDILVLEGRELPPFAVCAEAVDDVVDRVEVVVVVRMDVCAADELDRERQ